MAGRRIPRYLCSDHQGGEPLRRDGTSGARSAVISRAAVRTQTSLPTSFLRGRDESESRAERARRKQTQRDGMHKQGVASRTL